MALSSSRRSTGTKRTALVEKSSRSSGSCDRARQRFVVCLSNQGYGASLEVRKIYASVVDREAESLGMLRVIDESGEAYLYPQLQFGPIELPRAMAKAFSRPAAVSSPPARPRVSR